MCETRRTRRHARDQDGDAQEMVQGRWREGDGVRDMAWVRLQYRREGAGEKARTRRRGWREAEGGAEAGDTEEGSGRAEVGDADAGEAEMEEGSREEAQGRDEAEEARREELNNAEEGNADTGEPDAGKDDADAGEPDAGNMRREGQRRGGQCGGGGQRGGGRQEAGQGGGLTKTGAAVHRRGPHIPISMLVTSGWTSSCALDVVREAGKTVRQSREQAVEESKEGRDAWRASLDARHASLPPTGVLRDGEGDGVGEGDGARETAWARGCRRERARARDSAGERGRMQARDGAGEGRRGRLKGDGAQETA
ncbi:uncharacterized protein BXZ73DRAFT_81695 [Epithele typhae]|uniref:uncharacterized protein n=1 Tax=Epithele typhae TaxID=378194 RepID=UPI0020084388|nr:uncharacterized protein BXZ73DRAFT_81695 [Epithele typhae]KAH9914404.1 hypothetical protein BXZ73DRAFT_81695 [Epithele typhae]